MQSTIMMTSPDERNLLLQIPNSPLLRLLLPREQPFVQNILLLLLKIHRHFSNEFSLLDPQISQRVKFGNHSTSKPTCMNGSYLSRNKVKGHLSSVLQAIRVKFFIDSDQDLLSQLLHVRPSSNHKYVRHELFPDFNISQTDKTCHQQIFNRLVDEGVTNRLSVKSRGIVGYFIDVPSS